MIYEKDLRTDEMKLEDKRFWSAWRWGAFCMFIFLLFGWAIATSGSCANNTDQDAMTQCFATHSVK